VSWKSVIALMSAIMGLTTSALVLAGAVADARVAGIVVMAVSLVRIGPPWEWGWVSFALLWPWPRRFPFQPRACSTLLPEDEGRVNEGRASAR